MSKPFSGAIERGSRALFLTIIFILLLTSCSGKVEICYVNPNKLLQGYHGANVQHEAFQVKAKVWQQRLDSLSTELKVLSTAPTATRAGKEQQLLRYRDTVQQQAQQENQRLTQAVLNEINAYIKQYGKEKGYAFILGATEADNIVYAAEGTDISEDILKGLNEQYDRQHSITPNP